MATELETKIKISVDDKASTEVKSISDKLIKSTDEANKSQSNNIASIKNNTKETNIAVDEIGVGFKLLNATLISLIKLITQFKSGVSSVSSETNDLSRNINESNVSIKTLTNNVASATGEIIKTNKEASKLKLSINTATDSVKLFGINFVGVSKNVMTVVASLNEVRQSVVDASNKTIELAKNFLSTANNTKSLQTALKAIRSTLDSVVSLATSASRKIYDIGLSIGNLTTKLSAGGFAAFFGVGLRSATDLQTVMLKIESASSATTEQLNRLKATAENMGKTTVFSASEAGNALLLLTKAGFDAEKAIATVPSVLKLAQSASIDLGESTSITANLLSQFSLEAKTQEQAIASTERVINTLVGTANSANTDVLQLREAFRNLGAQVGVSNISIEESAAVFALAANNAEVGERAGTSFVAMLKEVSNPASAFRKEMALMGVSSDDFLTNIRALEAAGDGGEKALFALGDEARRMAQILLKEGSQAVVTKTQEIEKLGDVTGKAAEIMESGLSGAFKSFLSVADAAARALAEPIIVPLTAQLNEFTTKLNEFISAGVIQDFGKTIAENFTKVIEYTKELVQGINFAEWKQSFIDIKEDVLSFVNFFVGVSETIKNIKEKFSFGFTDFGADIDKLGNKVTDSTEKVVLDSKKIDEAGTVIKNAAKNADTTGIEKIATSIVQVKDKFNEATTAIEKNTQVYELATIESEKHIAAIKESEAVIKSLIEQYDKLKESVDKQALSGKLNDASAVKGRTELVMLANKIIVAEDNLIKVKENSAIKTDELTKATERLSLSRIEDAKRISEQANAEIEQQRVFAEALNAFGVVTKQQMQETIDATHQQFALLVDSGKLTAGQLEQAFSKYAETVLKNSEGVVDGFLASNASALNLSGTLDKIAIQYKPISSEIDGVVSSMDKLQLSNSTYGDTALASVRSLSDEMINLSRSSDTVVDSMQRISSSAISATNEVKKVMGGATHDMISYNNQVNDMLSKITDESKKMDALAAVRTAEMQRTLSSGGIPDAFATIANEAKIAEKIIGRFTDSFSLGMKKVSTDTEEATRKITAFSTNLEKTDSAIASFNSSSVKQTVENVRQLDAELEKINRRKI